MSLFRQNLPYGLACNSSVIEDTLRALDGIQDSTFCLHNQGINTLNHPERSPQSFCALCGDKIALFEDDPPDEYEQVDVYVGHHAPITGKTHIAAYGYGPNECPRCEPVFVKRGHQ